MSVNLPKCAVLGSGIMGGQIALSLALGGADVILWGRNEDSLDASIERCKVDFDFLVSKGLANSSERMRIRSKISSTKNLTEAVTGKGFIIEAIAEDLLLKQDLLLRAEAGSDEASVLSSTTSALSASELQSVLRRPQNFCIAHYAQPAHLVELVEVVAGKATSDHAVAETIRILRETNKTPVSCPDIPGFLWARIQHAVLREFASLVDQGLVTPEACDTILKVGYASRLPAMGAFEHADLAGLDLINSKAAKDVWADLSNVIDPADTAVGQLFRQGKLGMKSGEGFYDWKSRNPEEFKRKRDDEIVRRLKINRGGDVK